MLRLSMSRALKLPKAGDFAIPAPFPGKYPTRVGMIVEWEREGRSGVWRYVGKPNAIAAKRFEKEADKGGVRLLAVMEWDRAWKISETMLQWGEPRRAGARPGLQVVSPWLWTVYHPWHDLRAAATAWMRGGVWVHRIDCALGENTRLYTASPAIGAIHITDYRRRVNVVGQQPQKKKKPAPPQWANYGDIEARAVVAHTQGVQEAAPQAQWAWDTPIETAQPPQPQQAVTTTWQTMLVLEQERLHRARQQVEQEAPQPRRRHAWMDRWVVE